jgi:hypothetical protein
MEGRVSRFRDILIAAEEKRSRSNEKNEFTKYPTPQENSGESKDLTALDNSLFRLFRTTVDSEGAVSPAADQSNQKVDADPEERAAIIEEGVGVPRAWAEGYAGLSTMPAPTGITSNRWLRIIDAAGLFLDRWATEAIRHGWSDLDVFGCDPVRPDSRFDCMGLVMLLDRARIVSIDNAGADLITATGARQRYRRRPLPPGTISICDLRTRV